MYFAPPRSSLKDAMCPRPLCTTHLHSDPCKRLCFLCKFCVLTHSCVRKYVLGYAKNKLFLRDSVADRQIHGRVRVFPLVTCSLDNL